MDGGPKRMCFSVKWCVLHFHTHTRRLYSGMCCVRWASYAGKLFIWLYPNECNSVFSNWGQQDAPVFLLLPWIWHVPPAKRGPWPQSAQRGWTQDTNSLMSHIYPSNNPAWRQNDNTHVHTLRPACAETNIRSGSIFCGSLGETPSLPCSPLASASMFILNFLQ